MSIAGHRTRLEKLEQESSERTIELQSLAERREGREEKLAQLREETRAVYAAKQSEEEKIKCLSAEIATLALKLEQLERRKDRTRLET